MKVAGLELLGLRAYKQLHLPNLHCPLMTIVDYRGYRLLAACTLPLSRTSLVYGSADAGRTVHCDDDEMNQLMSQAGQMLNLKPHRTGSSGEAMIFGPCDIEGHRGNDRRLYVLDTARVFPPESPISHVLAIYLPADDERTMRSWRVAINVWRDSVSLRAGFLCSDDRRIACGENWVYLSPIAAELNRRASLVVGTEVYGDAVLLMQLRGHHLYHLVRPELLRSNSVPVSSDAFSYFGRWDANANNSEARQMSARIMNECIPRLVRKIVRGSVSPASVLELRDLMHEHGINIRYMGVLRAQLPQAHYDHLRSLLLTAMITRVVKAQFRARWRALKGVHDHEFKQLVVDVFNTLLGSSSAANDLWRLRLKTLLLMKFAWYSGDVLTVGELTPSFDLRVFVWRAELFISLSRSLGVVFTTKCITRMQAYGAFLTEAPFAVGDLEEQVFAVNSKPIEETQQMMESLLERSEALLPAFTNTDRNILARFEELDREHRARYGLEQHLSVDAMFDDAHETQAQLSAVQLQGLLDELTAASLEVARQLDLSSNASMIPFPPTSAAADVSDEAAASGISLHASDNSEQALLRFHTFMQRVFPEDDAVQCIPLFLLSHHYLVTGQADKAVPLCETAHQFIQRMEAPPLEVQVGSMYLLGRVLSAVGRHDAAFDMFNNAYSRLERAFRTANQFSTYEGTFTVDELREHAHMDLAMYVIAMTHATRKLLIFFCAIGDV
eukprot:TRINITY_DN4601_c0_g1_i3.p1 TRINITY_DN4601_c0_g1~~TRINITY_DN4601_c0_g1_i3.p1  ORF type:complete len:727 (-),score=189.20 TRINITY_DN4601_c0_g1_i3:2918-5098(-)